MNKYVGYTKERVILSLKSFVEYKGNFYATLFTDILNFIFTLIFYTIYNEVIPNEILNWNLSMFLLFFLLTNLTTKANNLLYFWKFRQNILGGNLNLYLTKPISPYVAIMLNGLKSGRFVTTMIVFLITLSTIMVLPTQSYGYAFIFYLIGYIGTLYLANSFEIFGFFMKGKSQFQKVRNNTRIVIKNFTFAPFENNFSLSTVIFLLLPQSLLAFFVTNILIGNINYFQEYFFILLLYTTIIISINLFIWKQGLKKYEAFG